MVAEDSGRKGAGSSVDLRSERQKLADQSLDVLQKIRRSESPKPTAEVRLLTASDPELRNVELAVQNAIDAISTYLCK